MQLNARPELKEVEALRALNRALHRLQSVLENPPESSTANQRVDLRADLWGAIKHWGKMQHQ